MSDGMRYFNKPWTFPRSITAGRVLVHKPYLGTPRHGARRQRLPLALPKEKLSRDLKRRKCGGLVRLHDPAREKDKRIDVLRDRCITQGAA